MQQSSCWPEMTEIGMNKVQLKHYMNEKQLNEAFSLQILNILQEAIQERGEAYLAVSGGKSPQGLFQILSKKKFPWEKVTILLTDERWIESTDSNSNEYLIRKNLLQNNAVNAQFIPLHCNCEEKNALDITERKIASLPCFDAVILGMGTDGHTASLFPCSLEVKKGLTTTDSLINVNPVTAPYKRISMTKNRLLNSKIIFLYLVGNEKLKTLNQALEGDDVLKMPIRAFLQNNEVPMKVQFAP